jgi:hypothetical protein
MAEFAIGLGVANFVLLLAAFAFLIKDINLTDRTAFHDRAQVDFLRERVKKLEASQMQPADDASDPIYSGR